MQEFVSLDYNGFPCACRCRHCFLGGYRPPKGVDYPRARAVVERFHTWAAGLEEPRPLVTFAVCFEGAMPLDQQCDYRRFLQRIGMEGARTIPINGLSFRPHVELERYLGTLRDIGLSTIHLTFYGEPASHDAFAGRAGDFEFLLEVARAGAALGLERTEFLLLQRGNAAELSRVAAVLDGIPGLTYRTVDPCDYSGRAMDLEEQRADRSDALALPEELQQCVSSQTRTEGEWVADALADRLPPKRWRGFFFIVDDESIDKLEREPCAELVEGLRRADAKWRQACPPMAALAGEYGDRVGTRLYTLRDLEQRWLRAHFTRLGDREPLGWLNRLQTRVAEK